MMLRQGNKYNTYSKLISRVTYHEVIKFENTKQGGSHLNLINMIMWMIRLNNSYEALLISVKFFGNSFIGKHSNKGWVVTYCELNCVKGLGTFSVVHGS